MAVLIFDGYFFMSGRLIFPPSEHFWQKLLRAHHPIFGSSFPKCFVQALNSSLPSDVIRSRSCVNRSGCGPRTAPVIGGRRLSSLFFLRLASPVRYVPGSSKVKSFAVLTFNSLFPSVFGARLSENCPKTAVFSSFS